MGRAESFDAVDENARTATGAAEAALKLLEAFLAETARKSVLETSERADIVALLTPRM